MKNIAEKVEKSIRKRAKDAGIEIIQMEVDEYLEEVLVYTNDYPNIEWNTIFQQIDDWERPINEEIEGAEDYIIFPIVGYADNIRDLLNRKAKA